jgi:hypothetical protein
MRIALSLGLFLATVPLAVARSGLDGVWVLCGKWTGYMGIALKIHSDRYKYWFYSDVGPSTFTSEITMPDGRVERHTSIEKPPRYPLTGRLKVRGDVIELVDAGHCYDRKWHRIVYRGVPCLLADEHYREWKQGKGFADDRLLFQLPRFDEKHPQMNYGGEERPDGTVTRTSPLPPK